MSFENYTKKEVTMVHGLETLERLNRATLTTNHGTPLPAGECCAEPQGTQKIKSVVIANCCDTGAQACYIDGKLVAGQDTYYAIEIVEAVGGESVPCTLSQWNIDDAPLNWPPSLDALQGKRIAD